MVAVMAVVAVVAVVVGGRRWCAVAALEFGRVAAAAGMGP